MDVDALRSENSVLLPPKQYPNYAQGLEEKYPRVVKRVRVMPNSGGN